MAGVPGPVPTGDRGAMSESRRPHDLMILEGIATTVNEDGAVNVAPMGPWVDRAITRLVLRPFAGSRTYANLRRTRAGIFHVSDDVELLAQAAVGDPEPPPELMEAPHGRGYILRDACRWYAFEVRNWHEEEGRTRLDCAIVDRGTLRDFFGWNRAKHAVLEAAILATRLQWIDRDFIKGQFDELAVLIDKTAGDQERRAFEFLRAYVERGGANSPR